MILFFYFFASLTLLSSILVVTSKNPVHSMLWLIFAFCNSAGLMILLGAEFLSMMLIIIYVGAVAVLFLFIIMMLTTRSDLTSHKFNFTKNKLYSILLGLFLFGDLSIIIYFGIKNRQNTPAFIPIEQTDNVFSIGTVLYTKFMLPFQTCGIILFSAMVASIYLTKRTLSGVKRQDINKQLLNNKENSINIVQVASHQGVEDINYDE